MFQLHSGRVNVAVMFISYRLEVLYPPPSLRDTSAGGGYGMTFFAITTQSHPPGNDKPVSKLLQFRRVEQAQRFHQHGGCALLHPPYNYCFVRESNDRSRGTLSLPCVCLGDRSLRFKSI
jgi:hypothetical protein